MHARPVMVRISGSATTTAKLVDSIDGIVGPRDRMLGLVKASAHGTRARRSLVKILRAKAAKWQQIALPQRAPRGSVGIRKRRAHDVETHGERLEPDAEEVVKGEVKHEPHDPRRARDSSPGPTGSMTRWRRSAIRRPSPLLSARLRPWA